MVLNGTNRPFTPHEIGNAAAIEYRLAQAVLLGLVGDQLADGFWLVYHRCSDAPVAARKMSDGLVPTPSSCPYCDADIIDDRGLTYDISCKLRAPVEFV